MKITKSVIEIYYHQTRICSHLRSYDYIGKMITIDDYMPPNCREYNEWNKERFIRWVEKIGPSTKAVIIKLFDSYKIEQQGYNGARFLLKLSDSYYSVQRLENACQYASEHLIVPRYRNIKAILKSSQDIHKSNTNIENNKNKANASSNGYIRGANYYGGNEKWGNKQ